MDSTTLKIIIEAQNNASKAFKDVEGALGNMKDRFGTEMNIIGGLVKGVAVGITALTASAVYFGKQSVDAFEESAKMTAQLEAVLKSTNGVAGVTKEKALELAQAMQKLTTYDDESVLSAENMLLTFTNIKENVFPQATETVLNMSTALGQDLQSSAIQLGKALNDPILGVTALRRVGVAFTEDQQKQIETLVKSGQTLKAQEMILKELGTEFGGSASAQAQTFSGKIIQVKNAIGDMMENIGEAIVTAIKPFVDSLQGFLALDTTKQKILDFSKVLQDLITNGLQKAVQYTKEWYEKIGGAEGIKQKFEELKTTLMTKVIPAVLEIINVIKTVTSFVLEHHTAIVNTVIAWEAFKVAISIVQIVMAIQKAIVVLTTSKLALTVATWALNTAIAVLTSPITLVVLAIVGLIAIGVLLYKNWDTIKAKAQPVFSAIGAFFTSMVKTVKEGALDMVNYVIDKVNWVIEKINKIPGIKMPKISQVGGDDDGGGGRAVGGPVSPGRSYLVGENGPELFVPPVAGNIQNSSQGLGSSISNVFSFNFAGAMIGNKDDLIREIQGAINREMELNKLGIR